MPAHVSEWPTVVVCEPDEPTRKSLCDHLTADRFKVLPAASADDALCLCRHDEPDLLLLDLVLPDASGLDVLREIRQADEFAGRFDPRLPVILLSGRIADAERVRGLEEGADDLLSRPVSYEELRARMTAVLRRAEDKGDAAICAGDIVVDPSRRRVLVRDQEVRMTKKEFDLLRVFAADPTRVFSKDELLASVWGRRPSPGATRTVDSHASRLRRKLDPERRRYIVNCWGIGYSLVSADHPVVPA